MSLTSPRSTGSFRTFFPRNCSTSLFSQRLTTTTPVTLETISVSRLSHGQAVFLTHDRLHRFLTADLAAPPFLPPRTAAPFTGDFTAQIFLGISSRFRRRYRLKPLLFAAFPQYSASFSDLAYFWRGIRIRAVAIL